MLLTRRGFISALGAGAAGSTLLNCNTIPPVPLPPAAMTDDINLRLLQRITFGPKTEDVARINAIGYDAFLDEQLDHTSIGDPDLDGMLSALDTIHLDISQLSGRLPATVAAQLVQATMIRAVHSNRQLFERMVEFWTDHFNIYHQKDPIRILKTIDDRDVIRAFALDNFARLLNASARSPAMLVYLDNNTNIVGSPNENYPREALELHTVGVDGGYTQQDVEELARALTGRAVEERGPNRGRYVFRAEDHDFGEKHVMGLTIPADGGEADGDIVMDFLARHASTARFIATKLVRHFIADSAPAAIVDRVANAYASSDGDIKSTLRVLFAKESMVAAEPKLKRPFHLFVDAMRRSGTVVTPRARLPEALRLMGHLPFDWPAPNGYPDSANYWAPGLLNRWNFGAAFGLGVLPGVPTNAMQIADANEVSETNEVVELWNQMFHHGEMPTDEADALAAYIESAPNDDVRRFQESFALALSSPGFQWH